MSGILGLLLAKAMGGGNVTVVQRFLASGTWTCPTGVTTVDYLVVAGGASGGVNFGGGGGAGGFRAAFVRFCANRVPGPCTHQPFPPHKFVCFYMDHEPMRRCGRGWS